VDDSVEGAAMNRDERDGWGLLFMVILCIGAAILFGMMLERNKQLDLAVKHSCAHYDTQSGDFKWNEEKP
jgi:hypothetical protein